jgi:hypothetical protein
MIVLCPSAFVQVDVGQWAEPHIPPAPMNYDEPTSGMPEFA